VYVADLGSFAMTDLGLFAFGTKIAAIASI